MYFSPICLRELLLWLFIVVANATVFSQSIILEPSDFVGHEIGSRFTLHHSVSDYLGHLHNEVPGSLLIPYGETFEGRPLELLVLSSPENLRNIEAIRSQHLDRMEGGTGLAQYDNVAIIWLSYNVHGNEAACTEAALEV